MKIKNIQLSLAVLLLLVVLSFSYYVSAQQNTNSSGNIFLDSDQDGLTDQEEALYGTDPKNADTDGDGYSDGTEVKSGYDPTKPAPGDKLAVANTSNSGAVLGTSDTNLTNQVSQKITELVQTAQENQSTTVNEDGTVSQDDATVTLDQLQEIIDQSMGTSGTTDDNLPEVKKEDIKILKQDYSKLSADEQTKRKKEDFLNYTVAIAYIFSSNSPTPITSSQDMSKVVTSIYQTVIQAMEARSTSNLTDLEKSSDKILEQLKLVEVPEEMVDTHIKAMRYTMYAKELSGTLTPNADDPLRDIANFSKMETFVESITSFTTDIQSKFAEYNISYSDADLQAKLKSFGLDGIKIDGTNIIDTVTTTTDTSVGVGITSTTTVGIGTTAN
ncbi:MAG: hypothetical protein WCV59_01735 [Parcubacteria group bacterium]|jgi:hypothetical protein